MMKETWTDEWPKEPGLYWFFGYPYGVKDITAPGLHLVRAVRNGQGTITYVREGHFFYRSEGAVGKFAPVELPELPI